MRETNIVQCNRHSYMDFSFQFRFGHCIYIDVGTWLHFYIRIFFSFDDVATAEPKIEFIFFSYSLPMLNQMRKRCGL